MSRTLTLLLTLATWPTLALAQREPPDAPRVPDDGGPASVYFAHSYDPEAWHRAGLGDRVSVHVKNFGTLLEKTNGTCSGLVLFVDGMAMRGLRPESCDRDQGHVRYLLQRTEQSHDTWSVLLGRPRHYVREVGISIGADEQFSVPSTASQFQLVVIPREPLWGFVGICLGTVALVVWLSLRTGLIRVRATGVQVLRRPYSLSMFQMVFWFSLVINAYVFIWMITGELDTITDSVLVLLGIGTGTALGASALESSARRKAEGSANPDPPAISQGFLADLLNEGDTVSLSRLQMVGWTIALGFIFCRSVYDRLHMPEFSLTLLGLMGISSGTYLGFKTQKVTTAVPTARPALSAATAPQPATPRDQDGSP